MAEPPADQPPQSSVADVWKRLKQHKVLQWTLAYAAAAYTLLHATQMVAESFDWPHLVVRIVTVALALGVPIVVLLAWYHGHKAQHRFSTAELSLLTVLLLIAGTALWGFMRSSAPGKTADDVAAERFLSEAPAGFRSPAGAQTIRGMYASFGDLSRRTAASRQLTSLVEKLSASDLDATTRKNVIAWYAMLGDLDSAYRFTNQTLDAFARYGTVGFAWGVLWLPEMRAFRQDARFQSLIRRLKFMAYWKVYGPPDDCDLHGEILLCR